MQLPVIIDPGNISWQILFYYKFRHALIVGDCEGDTADDDKINYKFEELLKQIRTDALQNDDVDAYFFVHQCINLVDDDTGTKQKIVVQY